MVRSNSPLTTTLTMRTTYAPSFHNTLLQINHPFKANMIDIVDQLLRHLIHKMVWSTDTFTLFLIVGALMMVGGVFLGTDGTVQVGGGRRRARNGRITSNGRVYLEY